MPRPPDSTISASVSSGQPGGGFLTALDELHPVPGDRERQPLDPRVGAGLRLSGLKTFGRSVAMHGALAHATFESSLPAYTGRVATSAVAVHAQRHGIGREPHAQPRGQARHELALATRDRRQDRRGIFLGLKLGHRRHPHFAPVRGAAGILEKPDLLGAPRAELLEPRRRWPCRRTTPASTGPPRRAASPMTSAINLFGIPLRSSSTMHQKMARPCVVSLVSYTQLAR